MSLVIGSVRSDTVQTASESRSSDIGVFNPLKRLWCVDWGCAPIPVRFFSLGWDSRRAFGRLRSSIAHPILSASGHACRDRCNTGGWPSSRNCLCRQRCRRGPQYQRALCLASRRRAPRRCGSGTSRAPPQRAGRGGRGVCDGVLGRCWLCYAEGGRRRLRLRGAHGAATSGGAITRAGWQPSPRAPDGVLAAGACRPGGCV